jgi:hypothetical protein
VTGITAFLGSRLVIAIIVQMNCRFDHEKLEVDQAALSFIVWLEPSLQKLCSRQFRIAHSSGPRTVEVKPGHN